MRQDGRITTEEWIKLPVERLVAKTLLSKSRKELELRNSNNSVHFVLNQDHEADPLLTSNEVRGLLGKTPRFIPTPKGIDPKDIARNCDIFGFRLIKTFNRSIYADSIAMANKDSLQSGIKTWKPRQFPHQSDYYEKYIKAYFSSSPSIGNIWRENCFKCPNLQRFILSFKEKAMDNAHAINSLRPSNRNNLRSKERYLLRDLKQYDIGYNISDKNMGPVIYSRDLYIQQCLLHLNDEKGTYEIIDKPKDVVLQETFQKLKNLLNSHKKDNVAVGRLTSTFLRWAEDSIRSQRLCKFYIIWKLHKKADTRGVRSRPIASNIGYLTGQISHFLHSQLVDDVMRHPHVLKDSITLIRRLEALQMCCREIYITTADVAALYPSINIDAGMDALRWFMHEHTRIPASLQALYLNLARFILENNYVECQDLEEGSKIFLQKIGTAMGTTFSVTYATIFMIWLETPIINDFRKHIVEYKRLIDDLFVIWSGPIQALCEFRRRLASAQSGILFEWQGSNGDATDPKTIDVDSLLRVNFLDLNIRIVDQRDSVGFELRVYRKPGNSYSYLPFGSFHARHITSGWLKAELQRLLTHSSTPEIWMEECRKFYEHLRRRGYPHKLLFRIFDQVSWCQRKEILGQAGKNVKVNKDSFFETYRGCVLSIRNAPGVDVFQKSMDLSLLELKDDSEWDIFPPRAFFSVKSALRLANILKR